MKPASKLQCGCGSRRGFVLPLVVVLTLAGALLVSAALTRSAAAHRTVRRQLNGYETHHMARGIQEVVSAWLRSTRGGTIETLIDEDGRALEVIAPDGSIITVRMEPGQRLVRQPDATLRGEALVDAEAMMLALQQIVGPDRSMYYSRPVGPVGVDINGADDAVIEAVVRAVVTDDAAVGRIMGEFATARADGEIDRAEIIQAAVGAALSNEDRLRLGRLLVEKPSLWVISAELGVSGARAAAMGRSASMPLRVFQGYVDVNLGDPGSPQAANPFLTWSELSLDEYRVARSLAPEGR